MLSGDFYKAKEQTVAMLKKKYEIKMLTEDDKGILIRLLREILRHKEAEFRHQLAKYYAELIAEYAHKNEFMKAYLMDKDILITVRRLINGSGTLEELLEAEKIIEQLNSEVLIDAEYKGKDRKFPERIKEIKRLQQLKLIYKGYGRSDGGN